MAETPGRSFRAPRALWRAYDRVCEQRETTASADLIAHVIRTVRQHGDEEARRLLDEALTELRRPRPGPKAKF